MADYAPSENLVNQHDSTDMVDKVVEFRFENKARVQAWKRCHDYQCEANAKSGNQSFPVKGIAAFGAENTALKQGHAEEHGSA